MKPLTPNNPNQPDLSQSTAFELAEQEKARRDANDKLAIDREQARNAKKEERLAQHRDSSMYEARGEHDRFYNNEDWERAAARTDPERRRQIREMFDEAILPKLPKKDGWHRIWASTTHNNDTPQKRLRLGYRFMTLDQAREEEWHADEFAVKDATSVYSGCLMHREMIAMETPEENFNDIMRELHHDAPMDQSRGIYEGLMAAGEQIRDAGGRTTMAPGMETLRAFTRPPKQFES